LFPSRGASNRNYVESRLLPNRCCLDSRLLPKGAASDRDCFEPRVLSNCCCLGSRLSRVAAVPELRGFATASSRGCSRTAAVSIRGYSRRAPLRIATASSCSHARTAAVADRSRFEPPSLRAAVTLACDCFESRPTRVATRRVVGIANLGCPGAAISNRGRFGRGCSESRLLPSHCHPGTGTASELAIPNWVAPGPRLPGTTPNCGHSEAGLLRNSATQNWRHPNWRPPRAACPQALSAERAVHSFGWGSPDFHSTVGHRQFRSVARAGRGLVRAAARCCLAGQFGIVRAGPGFASGRRGPALWCGSGWWARGLPGERSIRVPGVGFRVGGELRAGLLAGPVSRQSCGGMLPGERSIGSVGGPRFLFYLWGGDNFGCGRGVWVIGGVGD
jgi:hypothetical protein